jgi:hypothetical protein
MAKGYDRGTITHAYFQHGQFRIARIRWKTDASGDAAEHLREPINGTLYKVVIRPGDLTWTGTFHHRLLDQFGADVFDGQCDTLSAGAVADVTIRTTLGSDTGMFVPVAGIHQLVIDSSATPTQIYGTSEIWWLPDVDPRKALEFMR